MKHLLIIPERCLGDRWHNDAIRKIDAASGPYSDKVKNGIYDILILKNRRENERREKLGIEPQARSWCGIEKQEAQRIYALANSKSAVTFKKRAKALAQWLADKEHYGTLFNAEYINFFNSLEAV